MTIFKKINWLRRSGKAYCRLGKKSNKLWRMGGTWQITLIIVLLAVPAIAHAQSAGVEDAVNGVFKLFALLLTALQAVLWPILLLMGGLLNNDLLFSGGMQTMLLNIWTAIRDFVNIIFILGLVGVAIANIVGAGGDNFSVGKVLPKIALALIAVNFSFLMCKVVLDLVNVTTTAIFAIPLATDALSSSGEDFYRLDKMCEDISKLPSKGDNMKNNPFCEPENSSASTSAPAVGGNNTPKTTFLLMQAHAETNTSFTQGGSCKASDQSCSNGTITWPNPAYTDPAGQSQPTTQKINYVLKDSAKSFFSTFNSRNAAILMAVELMDITSIDDVKIDQYQTINSIKTLSINAIFTFIFLIIYATAFVALFAVLLVRVIVLWLAVALMPISFLGVAFDQAKKKLGDDDPMALFFKHAFVPIPVALVLTIGMIMISQIRKISPTVITSTDPATLGAITSNMSTLQELMAGLATAGFIWLAAFKAMEGTKADGIVNKIKGFVQNYGGQVAKLPGYIPLLPVYNKEGKPEYVGAAAINHLAGQELPFIQQQRQKFRNLWGDNQDDLVDNLKKTNDRDKARDIMQRMAKLGSYDEKSQKAIADALRRMPQLKNELKGAAGLSPQNLYDALTKGSLDSKQMEEVYRNNPNLFKGSAPAVSTNADKDQALREGKKALNEAATNPALEARIKELKDAIDKLDNAKTELDIQTASPLVRTLTKAFNEANEADKSINNPSLSGAFKSDGSVADQTKVNELGSQYKKLIENSGNEGNSETRLKEKIKEAFPDIIPADLQKIVDAIKAKAT